MPLLLRKSLILVKLETTYGTDIGPTGTDAVLVRDLTITPLESDSVSRDLVRAYLGASEQLLANIRVQCQFTVELAGSGTAGTAPRFGDALRACGMAQSLSSVLTGTSTAGSSNSITLAASASSTDGDYNGDIITITSGTGSGHVGLITGYVGSTKVATVRPITATFVPGATSGYSIAANATYKPVSNNFESVTIYYNVDGLLHKVTGARGTVSLSGEVGAIPTLQFTMTGIYNSPTDTAAPAATYTNQATPQIFKQGNTTAFQFYSYTDACLQSVSMDIGNNIVYRELVGCTKQVLITQRNVTGTVMIETPTIAAKDYFTAAITDGTTGNLTFAHGTTAGNRVSLVLNTVDIGNPSYSGQDDIAMLNLPYTAIPSGSGDNEFILTFA